MSEDAAMRLNGWRRLWVVGIVLWTALVVFVSMGNWPTTRSVSQTDVFRRLASDDAGQFPDSTEGYVPAGGPSRSWSPTPVAGSVVGIIGHRVRLIDGLADADIHRLMRTYHAALTAALREEQRAFTLAALAWWAIPTFTLYAFGWAIAWVRRGFSG